MDALLKLMFYFWGLLGIVAHAILKADQPGIRPIIDWYRVNNKGLVFNFLVYTFLYGMWAAMGRWAPAIGWNTWIPFANPWLGVMSVIGGYIGDSLWNNIVKKVEAKANRGGA